MQLQASLKPPAASGPHSAGWLQALRGLPIRWRILSIAALNAIAVTIFAVVIWDGAQILTSARNELRQTRNSDRLLTQLEGDAVRLQGLIHRYFTQPDMDQLQEIMELRETLLTTLKVHASADPILSRSADELLKSTERFVAAFSDLRNVQSAISTAYENQVLKSAQEISGLYGILEGGHARAIVADLAGAEQVARILLQHAGTDQRLLSHPEPRHLQ